MSKWNRVWIPILALCLLFPLFSISGTAEASLSPSVSAQSAILIEAESGTVVFSKNAEQRLPMASTTKIATALTALRLSSPDRLITVDAGAVGVEGSSVYLSEGEQLTLEQLLYALMLESANDAAVAIAIGVSGSEEAFVEEMNRLASELGLKDTHFVNPHGLDDEAHYTTSYELAILTSHALQNDLLRTVVSTRKATIPHAGNEGARLLINHNKLLRLYDPCIGVKTGFTKRSGRCLVSAAQRDGVTLIAVTLNAPDDWNDHQSMLDYGFLRYESVLLCRAEELSHSLPIVGGNVSEILLSNTEELSLTLPINRSEITVVTEAPHFEYAGIMAGEVCGKAIFYCDLDRDGTKERIGEVSLIACSTVTKPQKRGFWQWLLSLFGIK